MIQKQERIEIVNKQTYLGTEMTSSGRYAYVREVLVKRLPKLSSQVNDYSPTLILQRSRQGINFSMPLLNLYYFTVAKYGDQNYYLIRHILIKVLLSKITLNSVNKH